MFAPATQQQQQQKQKQSEPVSSAEEEALKWNTDCVYFLASPLTCKKGAECEYRHSEYARVNPRDCYYWLSGNCMNPKCGFRHPPLEGLLGNQGGGASAGSAQPSHATPHPGVTKQPVPCVFFQKGMCVKGDMCSFLHTPNPAAYKKQHPAEAKPATDPQFPKKPIENYTGEKKLPDANLSKAAHVDISAAPRVASGGLRDTRGVEGYVPKHVGYEPVVQKKGVGVVPCFTEVEHSLHKYGSDDNNNSFHNGKDADDILRESSPGFDVLVDNEARDSEYYHVEDRYGRRSQEGGNNMNEYDPDFSAMADGDGEAFRDHQRFDPYDQREDRYDAWGHRVSSERGDRLERRVYAVEDEKSENMLASDLRYRLAKQRKVNGMGSVRSHDYPAHEERGYRESRRDTAPRESSISSSRLQGRIKLRERSNGEEAHLERRGRERSELSHQGRLRDRIEGRIDENHSGNNQERGFRAPWVRRREIMEDERKSGFSAPETKSSKEESKTEPSLGKRKSLEEDHHHHNKRSGDSFAAPLPFSEILKRKRAAASGGSSNKKEETPQPKEEAGDETKLITEEKTEVVSEPKETHEGEEEGTRVMEEGEEVIGEEVYEGNEEEQTYEGDELNGEYYYEEGYEEDGDYTYEEGENVEGEEVVYAAEGEEAIEGEAAEGEEDKTVEMLS